MTTSLRPTQPTLNNAWRYLRLCSCLLILLFAGALSAATITIDHFDDVDSNDQPISTHVKIPGANPSVTQTFDPMSSVWGGKRQVILTRDMPVVAPSPNALFNWPGSVDFPLYSKLDYSEGTGSSELELKYGFGQLNTNEYEVVIDIVELDFGNTIDFKIELFVGAFPNAADPFDYGQALLVNSQVLSIPLDAVEKPGDPGEYLLSFNLTSAAFAGVSSYFDGNTNIAFMLLLDADLGADITIESILLQTLTGNGGGPGVVPEPSTYALGVSSLLGMLYVGYRRRRSKS